MNQATGADPSGGEALPRRRRWRRRLMLTAAVLEAGVLLLGHLAGWLPGSVDSGVQQGRLTVRAPTAPPRQGAPGVQRLDDAGAHGSLLYAPESDDPRPRPLVVMFHGAGANADQGLRLVRRQADARGVFVLAMKSTGATWDVIAGDFGPDIERLDAALAHAFARYRVDRGRMAVGGFSDGASYALSVGLTNGDVFAQVVAFSPGFVSAKQHHGHPKVFVTHGDRDTVLPVDETSRRLVPRLERKGYTVRYVEFDGGHGVHPDIAQEAVDWFVGG